MSLKEMKNIPNEEKAEYGKQVNELKSWATEVFENLDAKMKDKELKERYEKEKTFSLFNKKFKK